MTKLLAVTSVFYNTKKFFDTPETSLEGVLSNSSKHIYNIDDTDMERKVKVKVIFDHVFKYRGSHVITYLPEYEELVKIDPLYENFHKLLKEYYDGWDYEASFVNYPKVLADYDYEFVNKIFDAIFVSNENGQLAFYINADFVTE